VATSAHADLLFSDVTLAGTAGSGAKEMLLLLDWNPSPWNPAPDPGNAAFTYRWDGDASALDALAALDAALGARLAVVYHPSFPTAVFGMGFDFDDDGGGFTPGTPETSPPAVQPGSENGSATDPDDGYAEGWFSGYWAFYRGFDDGSNGIDWTSDAGGGNFHSQTDLLPDVAWAAFSYAPSFDTTGNPPSLAGLAVPEPSTGWLLVLGGLLARCRGRRRR
jgi:hypothetical protein